VRRDATSSTGARRSASWALAAEVQRPASQPGGDHRRPRRADTPRKRGNGSGSPLELHDPVRLPAGSGIGGGRLLPPRRRRSDAVPEIACPDPFPVDEVVRIERADAVLESPDDRRIEWAQRIPLIEPPDGPLPRPGIIGAERRAPPHPG